jgi:hypothetical protein
MQPLHLMVEGGGWSCHDVFWLPCCYVATLPTWTFGNSAAKRNETGESQIRQRVEPTSAGARNLVDETNAATEATKHDG